MKGSQPLPKLVPRTRWKKGRKTGQNRMGKLLAGMPGVRRGVRVSVIAGLGAAVMTIGLMILLSRIVGLALVSHHGATVVPLFVAAVLVVLARAFLVFVREMAAQRAAIHAKAVMRQRLFDHLLHLGPAYLRGERTGELIATATEGIDRLDAYVARYLPQRFLGVGIPLLVVVVIAWFDWISALLLVISVPIILLLMILIGSYTKQHVTRQWETLGQVSAQFLDVIQGLPTLLLFGAADRGRQRVVESSERFRVGTLSVLRIASISGAALELMSSVAIGLVAATLGIRLLDGGIAFGHAFAVFLLTPEFYRPLRELAVQRHAAMEGDAAARRIDEILETPVAPEPPAYPARVPWSGTIELFNLAYSYPGSSVPAVEDICMTLHAGTSTALVGQSGAGKTTLANLLLRFLEPSDGGITLGGIPIALVSAEEWRARVAFVPQRPYLFRGTIRENIRLARTGASDAEVARAAAQAGADRYVVELPDGYDTVIGERGAGLSAGQVQRLAIARAFLKDAPILVLDEPTSALDPESEGVIREALAQLSRNRTVLVIAHRLNTVMAAGQIAVLERGRLVAVGRHEDLLHPESEYRRLMRLPPRREVPV